MVEILEVLRAHPGFLLPAVLPFFFFFMWLLKRSPQKKNKIIDVSFQVIRFKSYEPGDEVDVKA